MHIGSLIAPTGAAATVRLEATDVPAPGLGAATIDVSYDASIISPTNCTKDPNGLFDLTLCNLAYQPNVVRFSGVRTTLGAVGILPLADITFEVVGATGQCSDLDVVVVTFTDPEGATIARTDTDGQICVAATGTSALDDTRADLGTSSLPISLDRGHDVFVPGWLARWFYLPLRLLSKVEARLQAGGSWR